MTQNLSQEFVSLQEGSPIVLDLEGLFGWSLEHLGITSLEDIPSENREIFGITSLEDLDIKRMPAVISGVKDDDENEEYKYYSFTLLIAVREGVGKESYEVQRDFVWLENRFAREDLVLAPDLSEKAALFLQQAQEQGWVMEDYDTVSEPAQSPEPEA